MHSQQSLRNSNHLLGYFLSNEVLYQETGLVFSKLAMVEHLDPNPNELPSVVVGDPVFDGKVILYVVKGELFFLSSTNLGRRN